MAFLRDPALDGQPDPARPKAHELRFDLRAYRRDHLGVYLCNVAFLAAIALIGLGCTMETVQPLFLGSMAVSSAIVFVVARRQGPYRCPRCGDLLARVIKAEPAIHYDCPRCRVEWDTGSSLDPPSWSA